MEAKTSNSSLLDKLGLDGLKDAASDYGTALVNNGMGKVSDTIDGLTDRLTDYADGKSSSIKGKSLGEGLKAKLQGKNPVLASVGGALSGVKDKVKDTVSAGAEALTGGGGGRGSRQQKLVNIVEWADVGVPVKVAYNQWTEFEEWSDFMKKVHNVEHDEDQGKVEIKGQVFLSHRTWESTIKEMVPDDRIIWKSKGQKGHLDGSVTFHEIAPRLTRICVVVEYYPRGFFEKTGQIWRAVGRRVRVELKRYVRHVMTSTILSPDDVEGWRGEIRDGDVVRSHDEVVEEERESDSKDHDRGREGDPEDEYEDEYDDDPESADGESDDDEAAEDEYDDYEDEEDNDEEDEQDAEDVADDDEDYEDEDERAGRRDDDSEDKRPAKPRARRSA
ncbi:SRPBCC family protein [Sinomonas sp. P47F7]|uniref:SRPBCC family protein n=1 Tax=Sinomonas sp. P47F7 TaxID=3410987 RepID=UPI003BF560BA